VQPSKLDVASSNLVSRSTEQVPLAPSAPPISTDLGVLGVPGQPLTVASFFSGVGLLDLGLEWAGWRTVSFSEIDRFASDRLAQRFPGVPNLGDLHGITHVPPATLWAGGFPCQPVSVAGRKQAQDDERWLWPAWVGLIRQFRPPYLLLENVRNLLAVNDGSAFGDVLGDLAASGYDAEWDCLPASALGAPHERDRVWIVGTRTEQQGHVAYPDHGGPLHAVRAGWDAAGDGSEDVAHAQSGGLAADGRSPGEAGHLDERSPDVAHPERIGQPGPRQPIQSIYPEAHRDGQAGQLGDGRWWRTEPGLGRVAHGVPHRVDRLRCLGNGVVPQVAEFIGWRLRGVIEAQQLDKAA
jgi:DNA (cytosine-5)-methyltransferase 1